MSAESKSKTQKFTNELGVSTKSICYKRCASYSTLIGRLTHIVATIMFLSAVLFEIHLPFHIIFIFSRKIDQKKPFFHAGFRLKTYR